MAFSLNYHVLLMLVVLSNVFWCDLLKEVDPNVESEDVTNAEGMDSLFSELANAIPGIDEAMSFAEMLK